MLIRRCRIVKAIMCVDHSYHLRKMNIFIRDPGSALSRMSGDVRSSFLYIFCGLTIIPNFVKRRKLNA
jgi:hypothetical protein